MLDQINNLILDMDGVLWRGETPQPGLVDFFTTLRRLQIGFVLATNNATKMAVQYTQKLARFEVDVPPEQILTSAETTASYLQGAYAAGTAVYVVGTDGLREAMQVKGFSVIGPDEVEQGATAPLVVAGFTPTATYRELAMGALLVQKGAAFVGTNPDKTIPHELGSLPGAGALLAVIETATGVAPVTIGKPGPIVFEEALRRLKGAKENTAMVGDRLSTDIAGAKGAGLTAILLLSGISTRAEAEACATPPDFIFDDIVELTGQLAARAGSARR